MEKPKLILVPTPIGNLEDITFRAVSTLKSVDCVLAEDTRTSKKLFLHFGIETLLSSYHIHNEHKKTQQIIEEILAGKKYALVSDAGTPAISDPGFLLVRECVKNEIEVECLPGATAFVPALVASAIPCNAFVFDGFLPHKKGRKTKLEQLAQEKRTVVLYESPHRIEKLVNQIVEFFGEERQICIARELSKMHEEILRGTAFSIANQLKIRKLKGEIVVVIAGKEWENNLK